MKRLPLTVLVHEGPIARAYLSRLRRAGLQPERILLLVYSHHPTTKRPMARWLPRGMRTQYAEHHQTAAYNYWPRHIRKAHPQLVHAMSSALGAICDDPDGMIAEIVGRPDYADAAARVERVFVRDLSDPALHRALSALGPGFVLYTGGGIVPPDLLSIHELRFIHIHPGFLPDVRGADGLLWSMLVRGRPGATCFLMAPGIDEGSLVAAHDMPSITFDLGEMPRPDDAILYRAVFSYYDPILRAETLVWAIGPYADDLSAMPATPQDLSQGITYHFLHPKLKRRALERIFPFRRPGTER